MGAYVNPQGMTKESWLQMNGLEIDGSPKADFKSLLQSGLMYVLWMNNGSFTAAAIAYSEKELKDLMWESPTDDREKKWYVVSERDLHFASRELKAYMDHAKERETIE